MRNFFWGCLFLFSALFCEEKQFHRIFVSVGPGFSFITLSKSSLVHYYWSDQGASTGTLEKKYSRLGILGDLGLSYVLKNRVSMGGYFHYHWLPTTAIVEKTSSGEKRNAFQPNMMVVSIDTEAYAFPYKSRGFNLSFLIETGLGIRYDQWSVSSDSDGTNTGFDYRNVNFTLGFGMRFLKTLNRQTELYTGYRQVFFFHQSLYYAIGSFEVGIHYAFDIPYQKDYDLEEKEHFKKVQEKNI